MTEKVMNYIGILKDNFGLLEDHYGFGRFRMTINSNDFKMNLPECKCFQDRKHAEALNIEIDNQAARVMISTLMVGEALRICEKARPYYVAAVMISLVSLVVYKKKGDNLDKNALPIAAYRDDMEKMIDQLKPMMLERLEYMDTVLDKAGL